MQVLIPFGGYAICALIIFFAGKKLSFYGDIIADISGWGKAWVGLVLMASVTSLPELMVGISSAAIVESADLAVGDVLGSCAFNLFILAAMDLFVPDRKPIFSLASSSHVLSAVLGVILLTLVGFGLFLPREFTFSPWIGLSSILFGIIYFFSMRLIYLFEQQKSVDKIAVARAQNQYQITLTKAVKAYVFYAVIIVVTALALPYFGEQIAEQTGMTKSVVGTLFLATSTSLPELAVSIASVRMGAIDLAIGNLLGSNLFNILILAIDDAFYTKGLLLKDAAEINLVSVLSTIIMASVIIIGLNMKTRAKRFILAWDAALILTIYVLNLILLFRFG